MKVVLTPRERKRVTNMRQLLAVAPNTASRTLDQASVVVANLIEVQTAKLSKMGDDNPKRKELQGSVDALLEVHGAIKRAEGRIRSLIKETNVRIEEIIKGESDES